MADDQTREPSLNMLNEELICVQCRKRKPVDKFVRDPHSPTGRRRRCSECEVKNRTEPKRDRRARHKVVTCRTRKSQKFHIPTKVLEDFYGWDLDVMEADMLVAVKEGCPPEENGGCGNPFRVIDDHYDDITLDIIDPTEPPFYGVNTQWICRTCNSRKGRRSKMRRAIEEAERQAIVRCSRQPVQMELFDP